MSSTSSACSWSLRRRISLATTAPPRTCRRPRRSRPRTSKTSTSSRLPSARSGRPPAAMLRQASQSSLPMARLHRRSRAVEDSASNRHTQRCYPHPRRQRAARLTSTRSARMLPTGPGVIAVGCRRQLWSAGLGTSTSLTSRARVCMQRSGRPSWCVMPSAKKIRCCEAWKHSAGTKGLRAARLAARARAAGAEVARRRGSMLHGPPPTSLPGAPYQVSQLASRSARRAPTRRPQ
mmetsp:Transcript_24097/g.63571  ORF Transcript_24097/g.63571 Transcript_24097/m.63571 type:complete len:235 (+) Transcript_24097:1094-1798(+)